MYGGTTQRIFVLGNGNVCIFRRGHLSPIVTHRLDGITHIAIGGKETGKRGKGEKRRKWGSAGGDGKRGRRIVANMFIGRGKKNCSFLWRRSMRNRRRETRYRATSTTAVASCRAFEVAFVISLDASLHLCFAKSESDLYAVAQGAQNPRCERIFFSCFCPW